MADREQLAILKKGVAAWNTWRKENPEVEPNLVGAYLRRSNLAGIDLSNANLYSTNLRKSVLTRANFSRAHMGGVDLSGANLHHANLRGAHLNGANINRADVSRASFSYAHMGLTVLGDLDLRQARGLTTVRHENASTVGIDTLYRSGGNIPEEFLRGCGLPEPMIALARSLAQKPGQYYSAFISYAHPDERFARKLRDDLQLNDVRVWFAPEDLKIGDAIEDSIEQAIQTYDKLILVISTSSLRRDWVQREFAKAREKERRSGATMLFPIRLDDAVFETAGEWADELRHYHIGDFRNWTNPLLYQNAINRLLRDLNAAPK